MDISNLPSIDREAITALKEATGEVFKEIIEAYLDDTKNRLTALHDAIKNSQTNAVIELSHSIKGSSGNIGACKLAALCAEIEHASRNNQFENLPTYTEQANSEFNIVEAELNTILASSC